MKWFRTPALSPDMNAVENVWHALKCHLGDEIPITQESLVDAITEFWQRHLTIEQCNKYIDHVKDSVFKHVVAVQGFATGM